MAAASRAAIICDTGALLDYLVSTAPDHARFVRAINRATTRYVPALVLAELDYFLRNERAAMRIFMRDLARGAFTFAPITQNQLSRAMEVDEAHASLSLGLVDASIIVLAEDLGLYRLATRDIRDFSAVRLRNGKAFELVVYPTDSDPG